MQAESFREKLLFSTLRIQPLNEDDSPNSVGTGFFVRSRLVRNPDLSLIFLVSNKHIFEASTKFVVNFHSRLDENTPDLKRIYRRKVQNFGESYYPHPDPNIDLACINLSSLLDEIFNEVYYRFLETDYFAKFDEDFLNIAQ